MNIPYALRRLLAAAVCLAAVQPAAAADLSGSSFVRQAADRASYEPGGKYSLFGSRGSITQRDGQITVSPTFTQQIGNLEFSRATINGNIGYTISFSGHGYEVHAPFDNYASRTASDRQGSIVSGGAASYSLNWTGHENHPADGYDGPQGGGYPAPAGARDIYSYTVNGTALSTRLNLTDTRTTGQHFADRFKNAGDMLTSGIGGSWRQATETNPNLNRWGNAADTVNGLVGMAGNVIGAAGEVIGVGDAVQGIGAGIDIATAAALDAANSAEADIRFAETVIGAENAKNTVVRSIQGFADANPNTAAGMQAVANAATVGYGAARGVGTATSTGSKAGSGAGSVVAKETAALNRIGQNQRNTVDLSGKPAGSVLNTQQNKKIDVLISQSQLGRATKGQTTQYEKPGNYSNAVKDFHSIGPGKIKDRGGNTKTGKLADGRDVIVRSKSDDGRPTLEIQQGKKKTKIRYGEK